MFLDLLPVSLAGEGSTMNSGQPPEKPALRQIDDSMYAAGIVDDVEFSVIVLGK